MSKVSFGIGSFNFGLKDRSIERVVLREYVQQVEDALESVDTISEHEILFFDEGYDDSVIIDSDLRTDAFFPFAFPAAVSFNLYIPIKTQARILGSEIDWMDVKTEHFRIVCPDTYYSKVSFIIPDDPDANPSTCVAIVRDYLRSVFSEKDIYGIDFQCIGPSPFHADCAIVGEAGRPSNGSVAFEPEWKKQIGYDNLVIKYDESVLNTDEATDIILESISEELSFFYEIVDSGNKWNKRWNLLLDLMKRLHDIHQMSVFTRIKKREVRYSRILADAYIETHSFGIERLQEDSFTRTHLINMYERIEVPIFRDYLLSELDSRIDYSINEIKDVISFHETRRLYNTQVFAVVIAAIIGGIAGALLTLVLTHLL